MFNEVFDKVLEKIKAKLVITDKKDNEYKRIESYYNLLLRETKNVMQGLPKV